MMPLDSLTEEANRLAAALAARLGRSEAEAVELALRNELRRAEAKVPLRERIRPLQEQVKSWPATGLEADKAFYDWLGGEE